MCGGVVISRKGKTNNGVKRVLHGIGASFCIGILLMLLEAALLQKGNMNESATRPILSITLFASSLLGCMTAGRGGKELRRVFAAVPGIVLTIMILLGRWIAGFRGMDGMFTLLLVICASAPALLVGLRKPRKRRK